MTPFMQAAIVATLTPTVASAGALLVGWMNSRKLKQIHIEINSRVTELIDLTRQASRAEGVKEGKESQIQNQGEDT